MRYSLFRAPGGILAHAEELRDDGTIDLDGYSFRILADDDADLRPLVAKLRQRTSEGIARTFLTVRSGRLLVAGDEVEGRLVWDDGGDSRAGLPYAVSIDGRRLTWDEFGRTLESFEGWRFKLSIQDLETAQPFSESGWGEHLNWTRNED